FSHELAKKFLIIVNLKNIYKINKWNEVRKCLKDINIDYTQTRNNKLILLNASVQLGLSIIRCWLNGSNCTINTKVIKNNLKDKNLEHTHHISMSMNGSKKWIT